MSAIYGRQLPTDGLLLADDLRLVLSPLRFPVSTFAWVIQLPTEGFWAIGPDIRVDGVEPVDHAVEPPLESRRPAVVPGLLRLLDPLLQRPLAGGEPVPLVRGRCPDPDEVRADRGAHDPGHTSEEVAARGDLLLDRGLRSREQVADHREAGEEGVEVGTRAMPLGRPASLIA